MEYIIGGEFIAEEEVLNDTDQNHKTSVSENDIPLDQTEWEPPGFVNPGTNTCYMNSVFQTLLNNEKFTQGLMEYYEKHNGYCYLNCNMKYN